MHAEAAYLFRHALLRDGAYSLQLPAERGRLHGLAIDVLESLFGGPAPGPETDSRGQTSLKAHDIDAIAGELAHHARQARELAGLDLVDRERLYLRRAASFSERSYLSAAAIQYLEALAELLEGSARATTLGRAGNVAHFSGRAYQAEGLFARALEVSTQCGDDRGRGHALASLANVYERTGRVAEAERTHIEVLELARTLGDVRTEGRTLANLTALRIRMGRPDGCVENYQQALHLIRQAGDKLNEATVLGNLAIVQYEEGRIELAERGFEEVLAITRAHKHRRLEGIALGNLACVRLRPGRAAQAWETHEQAVAILREVDDPQALGSHLCSFAESLAGLGQREQAQDCW